MSTQPQQQNKSLNPQETQTQASPTVAEVMAENLQKIANALDELTKIPLPKELIILYVQKKTRLSKKDIEAVFDAIKELNQTTTRKTQVQVKP
jgi:hypothetical protein